MANLILYSEKQLIHKGQQFHLIWFFSLSNVETRYGHLDTAKTRPNLCCWLSLQHGNTVFNMVVTIGPLADLHFLEIICLPPLT